MADVPTGLPWQDYEDVQLFINEYVHPASLNRGLRRLLENDRFLNDALTPVAKSGTFVESQKVLKVLGEDGVEYYVQLLNKVV